MRLEKLFNSTSVRDELTVTVTIGIFSRPDDNRCTDDNHITSQQC